MRLTALIPLLLVAACSDGGAEEKKAPARAASLSAGQWELASEVTTFRTVDEGAPKIDTPVGTRATQSVCIGGGRPPSELFAGEGYRCNFDNYYARNGRLNVTLQCAREDLSGTIAISADGNFEDGTLEFDRDIRTVLASDGDVEIVEHVTGRRTGDCTPEAAEGNQSNGQAG